MCAQYRRFVAGKADLRAEFLTAEDWPYFAGDGRPAADRIRERAAAGEFDNDRTRTWPRPARRRAACQPGPPHPWLRHRVPGGSRHSACRPS